jgi:hypothetical protein
LKALAPTTTTSLISFGSLTQVLSAGPNDQAAEDVLATAVPAYIVIGDLPTGLPTPTETPVPPPATDTPVPSGAKMNLTLFLHGIGESGDSTNPTGTSLSNKNPIRTQRNVNVYVINSSNIEIANKLGQVIYNPGNGNFTGTVDLGTSIPTGNYTIKVKSNNYLRKSASGIYAIALNANLNVPAITLVTGDSNDDNQLNILDYNIILGCYSDLGPASFCDQTRKDSSDLTDDGNVNQYDYNLFLREISVQRGS